MLELLLKYRYLTATLLGRVYSDGDHQGLKYVRNQLGKLYHNGFVERHYHSSRPAGEGSDPYIYTITPDGARAVLEREQWHEQRHLIWSRCEPKQHHDHHLGISSLQILLEHAGQEWALDEFTSDHEEQASQLRVEVPGLGRRTIWPDAEAVLKFPSDKRALFLFEFDRTRRSTNRLDERFRAYAAHLASKAAEKLKLERAVSGIVVVFLAANDTELKRLVIRAHALMSDRTIPRSMFLFWNSALWYDRGDRGESGRATAPVLRDPRVVLAEESVLTVHGDRRRLIKSTA